MSAFLGFLSMVISIATVAVTLFLLAVLGGRFAAVAAVLTLFLAALFILGGLR